MNFAPLTNTFKYEKLLQILNEFDTVIFDIGDVILEWDSVHQGLCRINGINDLRKMMSHPIWQDLEKGFIKRDQALSLLSNELNTPYERLEEIFQLSLKSLKVNQHVVDTLKNLKVNNKKLICLSNIDLESFYHLNNQYCFWNLFDLTYVSSLLHMNKPNADIFDYVIQHSELDVEKTIFIDNKLENLKQAENFGLRTIQFSNGQFNLRDKSNRKVKAVHNLGLESKKEKTKTYLHEQLRTSPFCKSFMADNVNLLKGYNFSEEIFSTAVILHISSQLPTDITEAMSKELLSHSEDKHYWCFYTNTSKPKHFPKDLDTTSMVLSFLFRSGKVTKEDIYPVAKAMIDNRNEDGIIQVYFDSNRPRTDAIVAVNVLFLMHQIGIGDKKELQKTKEFIYEYLVSDAYLEGTRYYPCPDVFLFFLSRLVTTNKNDYQNFISPLKQKLLLRVDATNHCVERALRGLALRQVGTINRVDFLKSLDCQLKDGGWPMYGLFIAAKSKTFFGSRELASSIMLESLIAMN